MNETWRASALKMPSKEGGYIAIYGYHEMEVLWFDLELGRWFKNSDCQIEHLGVAFWMNAPEYPNVDVPEKKP